MSHFLFYKVPLKFKLFISPYALLWKNSKRPPLKGALCAFDFGEGLKGYSDFLPWPSFGEKTLSQQLKEIKQGIFSERFKISKYNAFIDAKARFEKRNLFFSLKIPPSHFLIENLMTFKASSNLSSFKVVKVKLQNKYFLEQVKILKSLNKTYPDMKWRLDLNEASWDKYSKALSFFAGKIDFIEDPKKDSLKNPELLAEDWITQNQAQIKIVKASRDLINPVIKNSFSWKRIVFTHSFDHPLGQVISAFWAGIFYKTYPSFFETGAFLDFELERLKDYNIKSKEAFLKLPYGFGFGWGESLKKENWQSWM